MNNEYEDLFKEYRDSIQKTKKQNFGYQIKPNAQSSDYGNAMYGESWLTDDLLDSLYDKIGKFYSDPIIEFARIIGGKMGKTLKDVVKNGMEEFTASLKKRTNNIKFDVTDTKAAVRLLEMNEEIKFRDFINTFKFRIEATQLFFQEAPLAALQEAMNMVAEDLGRSLELVDIISNPPLKEATAELTAAIWNRNNKTRGTSSAYEKEFQIRDALTNVSAARVNLARIARNAAKGEATELSLTRAPIGINSL